MRQAGQLSNRDQAQSLADYLLTHGISTRVEPADGGWALWVREEDQLPQAMRQLQEFVANPLAPQYQQAAASAADLRKQQAREEQQRRKNFVEMRNRWDARPRGRKPLTIILIALCVFVAIANEGGQKLNTPFMSYLWFSPPPTNLLEQFSWTPTNAIDSGQIWRLVTPIFIHFNPMHLIFNMYMFYMFGSIIEVRRGSLRFGLLVLAIAVAANYGQYFFPFRVLPWLAHFDSTFRPLVTPSITFGGMSGVVYGLLGYLWMKSLFEPQLQLFISQGTVLFLIAWLVLGWTGALDRLVGGIANWEHTIGLITGIAIGYAPVAWRNLARR